MPDTQFAIIVAFDERTGEKGVKTMASFGRDETIASFDVKRTITRPSRESIQVSEELHVDFMGSELSFMNHSCNPSVFVDVVRGCIIALRPIALGDDVTFFYPSTEWLMASPFECKCESAQCIKIIEGAKHLSREVLSRYQCAPHIVRKLERNQHETTR